LHPAPSIVLLSTCSGAAYRLLFLLSFRELRELQRAA
jgi:hypothetical protein